MDEKIGAKEGKSTNLLYNLQLPEGLKELSYKELETLATEIRQLLITTIARTGGHLAPNLGVVELTLALHRVFNSPQDKIIWDVGHQSYVHKLLTGALGTVSTLQQLGGLRFPNRKRVNTMSLPPGTAVPPSRRRGSGRRPGPFRRRHKVIAVIGDGSLTGDGVRGPEPRRPFEPRPDGGFE